MAAVVDIACPDCGEYDAVRKVGVGRYRCEACGHEFSPADVLDAIDRGPAGGPADPGAGEDRD